MPSQDFTRLVGTTRARRAALVDRSVTERRASLESEAIAENARREQESQRSAITHRRSMTAGAFGGANAGRNYFDFVASIMSPDHEIRYDARQMRARARQLVRDNAHASGFVNEIANQVIGPNGILLQAKITRADGQPAKKTNAEIERGWKEWGMPETCSADGHDSWLDIQHTIMKTLPVDGEVILQKIPYFNNPFGYSVRFIDPDLLDDRYNRPAAQGVNEIRMGVEIDGWGRPVRYWLWNRHPSDVQAGPLERIPVDASEIIHRFIRYRPNQTRGVSWFAPVMLDLKLLDGYEEAELVATRMAAAKMGFVTYPDPEKAGFEPPKPGEEPRTMETAPGMIPELPPGAVFQEFNPTHPSTAFKEFVKAVLRSIARGLNMAYTTLTGDLEAVNFSSIRAGLLSERDAYRSLQKWLGIQICRPVYRDWLSMSLLHSAISVDSRLASNYYDVEWRGRGWKWVDPVNDLTAAALAIALGVDSHQSIAAESGKDFEEIVDEIAYEEAYALEMGVDISGDKGALPARDFNPNQPQDVGPAGPTPAPNSPEPENAATAWSRDALRARARARRLIAASNHAAQGEAGDDHMADKIVARLLPTLVAMAQQSERPPAIVNVAAPNAPPVNVTVRNDPGKVGVRRIKGVSRRQADGSLAFEHTEIVDPAGVA